LLFTLLLLPVINTSAQERLCDSAFEDCRTPLWQLIDAETQGIDVAFWFMQDSSYATKIINKFKAGVPVRVIMDPRANPTYAGNEAVLNQLKEAGIPMRYKLAEGIVHWKMMLFVGQGKLEFSGANYSGNFFVPDSPHVNYMDEAIYFTDDPSLIQSFKTKFDDVWTNAVDYGNYANVTGPLTRKYPIFPINPELNFPPSANGTQDFGARTQQRFNAETQKIDIIMYRITNQGYADTTIAAVKRGIPVRLIHEPDEYRNVARQWDSWNVDRMYMAGVQVKMRKHLGLNHQKSVLLYGQGMTIFGSSNWTGPSSNSQLEHNYFTTKTWFFNWFVNQFERKWNSTTENETFVPLPPTQPTYVAPANSAIAQPTELTLKWEGGPWAHKYDIYLGTTANPPLLVSDVSTFQSGAQTGQPLLDTGSVDDGVMESYTIPVALQPGTTYFWKVVGKTMANVTATGPTWSFVTAGTGAAPAAPTGLTATAVSPTQINLAWSDVGGETGYRVERSPNGSNSWVEIASPAADQTSFSNTQLTAQQTYFYRVRAANTSGFSPYSNVASATTPQTPPPGAGDIVLWAAEAQRFGNWSVVADATAAGGSRLSNPDAGAPKRSTALASPTDYVQMTFTATAGVDYRLWLRGKAQSDSWANDSVFIQFSDSVNSSGTPVFRIGTTAATEMNLEDCSGCGVQGWGWQDNGWGVGVFGPLIRFQTTGTHTIRIQVREDGLSLDQIVLSAQTYVNTAPGLLKNDNTILPKSSSGGGGAPPAAPTVSSTSPNSGPTTGGTSITVAGTGFQSGATVSLGGTPATNVEVVNSNSITAMTAARTEGTVNVVVTNADGQSGTLAGGFTYTAPQAPQAPSVTSVTPSSGTTAGGTPITISGSGFVAGATVAVGGTPATNVVVSNSATITATTPAHAAGSVDVVVTNSNGQSGGKLNAFTYTEPAGGETVLLSDDFNDASLNNSKWLANNLFSGFTDSTVPVTETQSLSIGPLKQNTDGSHYNGVRSLASHDFNGAYAYVRLMQAPNALTAADAFFTIGLNVDNCYRMYVEFGSLIVQKKIGGAKTTMLTLTFNSTNHAFWRIRHDAISGQIVFEVAPSSAGMPGTWTQLYAEPWNTSAVPLANVIFELKAGTWRNEGANPGTVTFDNFKAAKP
jgi:phosphatidylserine/phosphatidylglycerophosphate/cardiolipin synthase-like enzyme